MLERVRKQFFSLDYPEESLRVFHPSYDLHALILLSLALIIKPWFLLNGLEAPIAK